MRVRRGCSFHGLALNVNMDLAPFLRINPCGYAGMAMIQSADLAGPKTLEAAQQGLVKHLVEKINVTDLKQILGFDNE